MCEPACNKYTGGSSFTVSDSATAKACVERTYEATVELFAYLCEKYSLNPTADGVIISHKEGYSRGMASNHGEPEHLWKGLGLSYTMDGFRKAVKNKMASTTTASSTASGTSIYTKKTQEENADGSTETITADFPYGIRYITDALFGRRQFRLGETDKACQCRRFNRKPNPV